MDVVLKGDDTEFQRDLTRLAAEKRTNVKRELRASARRLCVNLNFETEPRGFDEAAHFSGVKAVHKDIGKVYATASGAYEILRQRDSRRANLFYAAMKRGDFNKAKALLSKSGTAWSDVPIKPFDVTLHAKARNFRGRVRQKIPSQIVTDNKPLNKYIDQEVARVGIGKAGWAMCAKELGGTRGIPAWAKGKHKVKHQLGHVVDRSDDPDNPVIELHNDVVYADNIVDNGKLEKAMERERGILKNLIERAIDASIRKSGFHE